MDDPLDADGSAGSGHCMEELTGSLRATQLRTPAVHRPSFARADGAHDDRPFAGADGAHGNRPFAGADGAHGDRPFAGADNAHGDRPFAGADNAHGGRPFAGADNAHGDRPFAGADAAHGDSHMPDVKPDCFAADARASVVGTYTQHRPPHAAAVTAGVASAPGSGDASNASGCSGGRVVESNASGCSGGRIDESAAATFFVHRALLEAPRGCGSAQIAGDARGGNSLSGVALKLPPRGELVFDGAFEGGNIAGAHPSYGHGLQIRGCRIHGPRSHRPAPARQHHNARRPNQPESQPPC
eukprot:362360-Chlamydomonas_euryale.AAC.1